MGFEEAEDTAGVMDLELTEDESTTGKLFFASDVFASKYFILQHARAPRKNSTEARRSDTNIRHKLQTQAINQYCATIRPPTPPKNPWSAAVSRGAARIVASRGLFSRSSLCCQFLCIPRNWQDVDSPAILALITSSKNLNLSSSNGQFLL